MDSIGVTDPLRITAGEELISSFLAEWYSGKETILCRTSGSTGSPKMIQIPRLQMEKSALRSIKYFGLSASSHLHSIISPETIGGKMACIRAISAGASFSCEKPSNRPLLDSRTAVIDIISLVPSQMNHLLDLKDQPGQPVIRKYLIGGAPLPPPLRYRIAESGADVFESYGMTETASHIALRKVRNEEGFFQTLPGIYVEAENGTLRIDIEGWKSFLTNDVAEVISPTRFRIIGRSDNVINSGGKKIHPEQVERRLAKALGFPLMITSSNDPQWGEKVVLIAEKDIEAFEDQREAAARILGICRELLLPWEVPKEIFFGQIPRTPNGKIKRK